MPEPRWKPPYRFRFTKDSETVAYGWEYHTGTCLVRFGVPADQPYVPLESFTTLEEARKWGVQRGYAVADGWGLTR